MRDGIRRRTIAVGETIMQMLVQLDADSHLPLHSHPEAQMSHVLSGRLLLSIDGEPHELRPGDSVFISGHVSHAADALEDTLVLDTFAPPRADLLAEDAARIS